MKFVLIFIKLSCFFYLGFSQLNNKTVFTLQDSLRGSLNENRTWWDVQHYNIIVQPNYETKTLKGSVGIIAKIDTSLVKQCLQTNKLIKQIDLQDGLYIDSIVVDAVEINPVTKAFITTQKFSLAFNKLGNVYWVDFYSLYKNFNYLFDGFTVYYHGKPRVANNPPWDGGWIWKKDAKGRPWMSVACQGLGASSWYPCKDHQSDEPESGASITVVVPDTLMAIANGINNSKTTLPTNWSLPANHHAYTWQVSNPINTYNVVPYIGKYENIKDTFNGLKGVLDLNYWVLDYNVEKANKQFTQVKQMLRAFEYWFGAYPFYEDGYKLVESPHLGMEHQSAIAYGNKFLNGYLGRDLSASGWGNKWDFIIVHESGHEWFANSITTKDIADMWVHEGFTCYSETLFTEYYYGKQAANEYCYGLRRNIKNDETIIGQYGVNKEGSGDMYTKAANMLHTIRQMMNNDEKFREMLLEMNKIFYHSTISSAAIENFIFQFSGLPLHQFFNQYLRTINIPQLEYKQEGKKLHLKINNTVEGFELLLNCPNAKTIKATTQWTITRLNKKQRKNFSIKSIEQRYLVELKNAN